MRIKDSSRNNAEGSSKKESKKKNCKQKTEGNISVTEENKQEKTLPTTVKVDKEGQHKVSPSNDEPEKQPQVTQWQEYPRIPTRTDVIGYICHLSRTYVLILNTFWINLNLVNAIM